MVSDPSGGPIPAYRRPAEAVLRRRLQEPRRFIQVVTGPRQVGKTTMVRQAATELEAPVLLASADDPGLRDRSWLEARWQAARTMARLDERVQPVLVLDEIQKIPGWSEIVKRLWDEDSAAGAGPRLVLLGSAPLVVQVGLAESLAGRFEEIRLGHWSFGEMRDAFGWDLERFLFFGGYPGSAPLVEDLDRWRSYVLDSLIETALSRDILLLTRVDKPALLRQLFRLGCDLSAQIVSYQKLMGQLQGAGNTTTLAHYLHLLGVAGLLTGLPKYSGSRVRSRGSSPKLLVLDTGLLSAMSGVTPAEAREDPSYRGRLVESALGAHLVNTAGRGMEVSWWRERDREVDFVLSAGRGTPLAIEVASGRRKPSLPGLDAFGKAYGGRSLLIGAPGLPLETALLSSPEHLLAT
ncbi:MAG: ATP-binding protein [Candidatus Limnocylindrales bacterium]